MSIYGNQTWYTGELQPNNFAAQPYYKAGKQTRATGLPDAFYGADMGLETPPAAGPFGSHGLNENWDWSQDHGKEGLAKALILATILYGAIAVWKPGVKLADWLTKKK